MRESATRPQPLSRCKQRSCGLIAEGIRDLEVEFVVCGVWAIVDVEVGAVIEHKDHFLAGLGDVAQATVDADSVSRVVVLQQVAPRPARVKRYIGPQTRKMRGEAAAGQVDDIFLEDGRHREVRRLSPLDLGEFL